MVRMFLTLGAASVDGRRRWFIGRHRALAPRYDCRIRAALPEAGEFLGFGLVALHALLLLAFEALLPQHQLVEVDLVPIEIGTVDAGEFHLAADRDPARSAHARAVDHDRIQADHRANAARTGELSTGLHHRQRPDGNDLFDIIVLLEDLVQDYGDEALGAEGAVVGRHPELVGKTRKAVVPEHQVLAAKSDDGNRVGAQLLVAPQLREDGGNSQASSDEDGLPLLLNVRCQAQRADEIEDGGSFGHGHHLEGSFADRLDYDGNRAALAVIIRNGQRNALPGFVDPQHDEMSRLARPGYLRGQYLP